MNKIISQQTAQILIDINAVSFRFDPPFTFTSGLKSPIYLDNRLVLSYPKERKQIVDFYLQIIKTEVGLDKIDYISGTASAAIPQASLVAAALELPLVYVRPSTKSYGKGNKLEGFLKKSSRVLIIEDHISTATSVVNNAQTVREQGGEVVACIATTTYETEASISLLKENDIKFYTLTTGKIIVAQAYQSGKLTKDEKESIELWLKSPKDWQDK
ncbi:orotate phosphoribosyltransferase [Candidatus Roizmanbacteria bacterium RIFCSPHIGHO2_02_FULL_37_13b]|uniref:Orotate phosphoribosyltransferase n=1 Tax=Candidatus Roizmanbacteria bacterium RIFCSPLOWO2_02_FULL_36_11 TaxID=1802071 RepID=A0A1F7JIS6_9BACT|nr:MAG: orotate phosphoribosyltransferase [Candidatus Roizmanbacteria bacterium RIFCSPHIGHO2_02_FULL_37_13b]OGK55500.1 MAG: orotate phosphoribosyltransferase [Candidatus Roizmanbacteria bacterium RIFCSPLOWO2_02_FULL_36_11]